MDTYHQGDTEVISTQLFADRHGLRFNDLLLLQRALTHRSYLNEHSEALEDNERLEFLGDAVLDFLVGAWLYHQFPEMQEGDLTRLRSALVRTEQLAEFAREIGLGSVMLLGRGEAENGGRSRPALLCATFEALIGALYLDSGLIGVQLFIEPRLTEATRRIIADHKEKDPKSSLQEWVQSQGFGPPVYQMITSSGPEHAKMFEVEVLINGQAFGHGSGNSKQAATKAAARAALEILNLE